MRKRRACAVTLVALTVGASLAVLQSASAGRGGAAKPEAKVVSVAELLPGKKTDPGYSGLGYSALVRAQKVFHISKSAVAESVDVAAQTETYRGFAQQGYSLVVGWGGQYEDGALKAAAQFPKTFFTVGSGTRGNGKNYSSVDLAGEQWTFLVGYVLGKLTKTGKVGIVTGPCFDATARQGHGVVQGVKYANPKAKVVITSLSSFDDPAAAKEAALAQIASGVDMIEVNLNTGNLGVYQAAGQDKGKHVLVATEFTDEHAKAPTTVLTSSVRDSGVVVMEVVKRINNGTFNGKPIRISIRKADPGLAPFRGLAPSSLYSQAKGIQAQIVSGKIKVRADGSCPFKSA